MEWKLLKVLMCPSWMFAPAFALSSLSHVLYTPDQPHLLPIGDQQSCLNSGLRQTHRQIVCAYCPCSSILPICLIFSFLTLRAFDLIVLRRPGNPHCLLCNDNNIAWSSACLFWKWKLSFTSTYVALGSLPQPWPNVEYMFLVSKWTYITHLKNMS